MRSALLLLSLAAACSPAARSTAPPPEAPRAAAADERDVASLLATGVTPGGEACILRDVDGRHVLGLPLVSAVNPRPELPVDLTRRLREERGGFTLYTLYGRFGEGPLPLATLTRHAPPRGPLLVAFITPEGVYLVGPAGAGARGAIDLDALGGALDDARLGADHLVAVVPSPDASVDVLAATLAEIDARGAEPALAALLPAGTRSRASATARSAPRADDGMCGPRPAPSREGELSVASLRDALAELVPGIRECRAKESSYEAARGGEIDLSIRVGEGGEVEHACVERDTLGDASLRACVLEHARRLVSDAPSPPGSVDVRVPLRIPRDERDLARGVCPSR